MCLAEATRIVTGLDRINLGVWGEALLNESKQNERSLEVRDGRVGGFIIIELV